MASESEITGLLIAVIFAGQHTSSVTTTWSAYHMVADQQKVSQESGIARDSQPGAACHQPQGC